MEQRIYEVIKCPFFSWRGGERGGILRYMAREPYADVWPKVAETAFVASSADLIGDVSVGEHASIWYNCTLRADINKIVIGDYSNIQDNSCIHLADDYGCYVGNYVTVGHGVILHACTVEDDCLIGMGSIILDGAVIGKGSVVGANALVTKGTIIPPNSLVLGSPAKVVKDLGPESQAKNHKWAEKYVRVASGYMNRNISSAQS